jgi:DNA-directed RNA polymerase delta subunit
MSDKIYLILKQEKKPLHYIEVAKLINDAVFDKKVAQPATVHNELIMDKKYILVGRGIYGLEEWGYMAGTVTEIIEAILKASGSMQKDDLIQKVLEQRMVRKTTIILSLSNKEKFSKLPTGEFQLANA